MGLRAFLLLALKMCYYEIFVDWSKVIGMWVSRLLLSGSDVVHSTTDKEGFGHFIGQVYNQKRPHSALGNHLIPVEFEKQNLS